MKHTARISLRMLAAAAAMTLLLSACGDDDASSDEVQDIVDDLLEDDAADDTSDDDTDEPADDTTEPADGVDEPDDTTDEPADGVDEPDDTGDDAPEPTVGVIAESLVGTPVTGAPITDGEVSVYFNNGESGFLVAIWHGPGLTDFTGLCPGNSLSPDGATFSFTSNSPATAGACDGFPTDVSSVRVCTGGVMLNQTLIPNDSAGTLFGSLEAWGDDGTIVGMYGQAPNTPGTPVIDYTADSYTISTMFTNDGSTEISCEAPLI